MTSFLQSQLPKIYESSVLTDYSKVGFVSALCRALKTVGMVPMTSIWPFDVMANSEFPAADGIYVFPFDFPDSTTFRVQSNVYRPCFYIALYIGDTATVTNVTRLNNYVVIDGAVRLDGPATLDNITSKPRSRGVTNQGYGILTDIATTNYPNSGGQLIQKADWLPYVGHATVVDVSRLPVGHWFVYLGPAGLFMYVGSGPTRAQFGDLLSFGQLAMGSRIIGRAKPVLEDGNLNRINPMIGFPMNEASITSEIWNTNSTTTYFNQLRSKILKMQSDLHVADATNSSIVNCWLFNLENLEFPIFPYYGPDTKPSPRLLSTGGGGHILGHAILVPDGLESDLTQKFGPVVPELDASNVRPQWTDVFTGEGVRFCDISAPLGVIVDPNTTLDWYLVPTYNTGQLIALKIEPNTPGTIVDALSFGSLLQTGDDQYNLGTGGYAASFPNPVVITLTPGAGNSWTAPGAGNNAQLALVPASTTQASHTADWTMTLNVSDPADTLYKVQCAIFNKDSPQTGTATAEGFNRIEVQYNFNGAYVTAIKVECAGTNAAYVNTAGGLSFVSTTYTAFVAKDTLSGSARLLLRFLQLRDDPGATTRGSNGEVRNLHILKFRYL